MSRLIDNIKRLAGMVKNETKSGGNTAVRIGGLFEEIAAELEAKYDKAECDEFLLKLNRDKLDKTGDGKDVVVSFVGAEERENVRAGDTLAMLWGKVWKWFDGLAAVAFSGKAQDLIDDADHRLVADVEKNRWNDTFTQQETDEKDAQVLKTAQEYADNRVTDLGSDVYRKSEVYTKQEADIRHEGDLSEAKKYATDRISELVNGSPAALDTLYEIANALNNDPNFATTIMALINGKADTGHKHTKSQITDFPTSMPASDVYAWAKASSKPTYTCSEVGAAPANHTHDYAAKTHSHNADQITDTTTKVMMTKEERSKLAGLESIVASKAANGYIKVGGIIIQWGKGGSNTTDLVTINFPTAFPSTCCSVVVSGIRNKNGSNGHNYVYNVTRTNFQATFDNGPGYFIAIGY